MKFIISNPEIASRMASNAKKRYLEIFTAEKQAKEYNRLYRNILKK
jgi:glycosyltransferase involved in cell wall biosynthesis